MGNNEHVIRKGIEHYFRTHEDDLKNGYNPYHMFLGNGIIEYMTRVERGENPQDVEVEELNIIKNRVRNHIGNITGSGIVKELGELDNEDLVVGVTKEVIEEKYKEDIRKVNDLLRYKNKHNINTKEEVYLLVLKEIKDIIPIHVISKFVGDRDVRGFVRRVHEAYRYETNHNKERTKTYIRLMYSTSVDPREFDPTHTEELDWNNLNNVIYGFIFKEIDIKSKIGVVGNTRRYLGYVNNWNRTKGHNKIKEHDIEDSYLEAVGLANNINPKTTEGVYTNIMKEIIGRFIGNEEVQKFNNKGFNQLEHDIDLELKRSGVAFLPIGKDKIVFGRKMAVLVKEPQGYSVAGSSAYYNISKSHVEGIIRVALKRRQ